MKQDETSTPVDETSMPHGKAGPSGRRDKLIGALIILSILAAIALFIYAGSILAGDPW